jgi:hypothetical protein
MQGAGLPCSVPCKGVFMWWRGSVPSAMSHLTCAQISSMASYVRPAHVAWVRGQCSAPLPKTCLHADPISSSSAAGAMVHKLLQVLKPTGHLAHVFNAHSDTSALDRARELHAAGAGPSVGDTLVEPNGAQLQEVRPASAVVLPCLNTLQLLVRPGALGSAALPAFYRLAAQSVLLLPCTARAQHESIGSAIFLK